MTVAWKYEANADIYAFLHPFHHGWAQYARL
eukprot:SAG31_NODE_24204_length_486_cov_2.780362_1_plen_30_part_10